MTEPVKRFQPAVSAVKVQRLDGSEFESYTLFAGAGLGRDHRVDVHIYVGKDGKVEVHAFKPDGGVEISLCEGPI